MSAPGPTSLAATSPANSTAPPSPAHSNKRRKTGSATSRGVACLTPDQLAKKRLNDREAQRAIRERTKAQVGRLEKRVQELTSQQPYQELQAVVRQKDAIQAENEEIRRRLESVLSVIQPIVTAHGLTDLASAVHADGQQIPPPPIPQLGVLRDSFNDGLDGAQAYSEEESSHAAASPSPNSATPYHQRFDLQPGPKIGPERVWSPADAFSYQKQNLHHGLDLNESGERLGISFLLEGSQHVAKLNSVSRISHGSHTSSRPYTPLPSSPFTDHGLAPWAAPCRNLEATCTLDGLLLNFLQSKRKEAAEGASLQKVVGPAYPSVSSLLNPKLESHPLSKVFTDILGTFPTIDALPQQTAVLFIMFLIMRWQIYPTRENYERLPDWMTPRPSQLFTPHPAWIDYLPWPRMRDKLVECHDEYPFESFTLPYTTTLSLNWPYEATDALLCSSESEELMINPVFERHLRNLSNWSLGPAFARAHPVLADLARIKPEETRLPSTQRG